MRNQQEKRLIEPTAVRKVPVHLRLTILPRKHALRPTKPKRLQTERQRMPAAAAGRKLRSTGNLT
jgi:hypothetical protein